MVDGVGGAGVGGLKNLANMAKRSGSPVKMLVPYDRLGAAKFQDHDCAEHGPRGAPAVRASFAERARSLVLHGFKPKDAADITLQEILLEHRNDPKMAAKARAEAEDFLRRIRDGLI